MEVMTYTNANEEQLLRKNEKYNDDTKHDSVFYKPSLTNLVPSSLLALLDDKNKSILLLKRQIHNQKLQLGFYLNKVLNNPQVMQLADSCAPYEAEENIHVNLAMVRFCKQTGLKSTLMNLHQRMLCMEKNILNVAQQQEEMVHGIVTKIAEFAKHDTITEGNPKVFLSKLNENDDKVDNLAKILGSTIKLRKELDVFKTCCNRLVIIEDERNSLVDQVYSMPVSKRLSYGVLLAAQYEKLRLEKEIVQLKRENKALNERLTHSPQSPQLVDAFTVPAIPAAPGADKTNVHKLLELVNTDAVSILNISKDRKDKYVEEIAKLQDANKELQVQIELMHDVELEREGLELRLRQTRIELEKVQDEKNQDIVKIRGELQSIESEREYLQNKLIYYYDLEDQLQYMRANVEDLEVVKKQRDYYKTQAEDLEGIRLAYAQLMETCAIRADDGDNTNNLNELLDKIQGLEKERENMLTETSNLGNIIIDQQLQIKELLVIIQEIAKHSEESETLKSNSFTQTITFSDFLGGYASLGKNAENKCALSQTNEEIELKQLLKELKSPNRPSRIVFTSSVDNIKQSDHSDEKPYRDSFVKSTELFEQENKGNCKAIPSPLLSTTSVEVQTLNNKGETESMKAQLESSSKVEGVIKVSDSLSFRVTCTPPTSNNPNSQPITTKTTSTLTHIASEKEIRSSNLASLSSSKSVIRDEFELMKDSSNEALIVTLPSIHHQVGNFVTTVQCMRKSLSSLSRSRVEEHGKNLSLHSTKDSLNTMFESDLERQATSPNFPIGDRNASVFISRNCTHSEVSFVESESTDIEHTIGEDGDLGVGISITNRLKKLTSELQCTLSKPGGKDSLVNAVIDMYSTLFTKNN